MRHLDLILMRHPRLRDIDFQRLVQRVKEDPRANWRELVEASAPVVYTAALRLAHRVGNAEAVAEQATREVFEAIAADDFAILRAYIGYGKWTSELVRLTQLAPALATARTDREFPPLDGNAAIEDEVAPVSALESRYAELLVKEGDAFVTAVRRAVHVLHRHDRLMLGLRYEQGLTVAELDQLFRLGTPERVAGILDRLIDKIQPITAVAEAWELDSSQRHALARHVLFDLYRSGSLESDEEHDSAPALQHR